MYGERFCYFILLRVTHPFPNITFNRSGLLREQLNKYVTPEQAYPKIRHFCSYRERTHKEVKDKLYGMGLPTKEVNILLSTLIGEDYLNEERFAIQYAGGHFRQKKWGRVKIQYALRLKGVSEANIKKALSDLVGSEYEAMLLKLAEKKWESLQTENFLSQQAKTFAYLAQKGFEGPVIQKAIGVLKARK
jgi:regulatory protein